MRLDLRNLIGNILIISGILITIWEIFYPIRISKPEGFLSFLITIFLVPSNSLIIEIALVFLIITYGRNSK